MANPLSSMDRNASKTSAATERRGSREVSIGQYLINRLIDYGIHDCFGIPGDYVLRFYSLLEESPIRVVGCTREDCAGFAADAYARIHGMGALCVTVGVQQRGGGFCGKVPGGDAYWFARTQGAGK